MDCDQNMTIFSDEEEEQMVGSVAREEQEQEHPVQNSIGSEPVPERASVLEPDPVDEEEQEQEHPVQNSSSEVVEGHGRNPDAPDTLEQEQEQEDPDFLPAEPRYLVDHIRRMALPGSVLGSDRFSRLYIKISRRSSGRCLGRFDWTLWPSDGRDVALCGPIRSRKQLLRALGRPITATSPDRVNHLVALAFEARGLLGCSPF